MNDRNGKKTFWMGDRNEDAQRPSRRRSIAALLAFIAYGPFTASAETFGIGDARGSTETGTTGTAALREGAEDAFTAWIITDIHYLAEELHDDGTAYARLLSAGDKWSARSWTRWPGRWAKPRIAPTVSSWTGT